VLVAAFLTVATPTNVSAEDPEPPEPWEPEWFVEGEGNYFEITRSSHLNITLISSEVVYIYLESLPRIVSFNIEPRSSATTTRITLLGFETSKCYFRYQDGYFQERFTTDGLGSFYYTQDISTRHHVFIQEMKSTIYIKPDGSVDPATAPISRIGDTYTLTDNIYESIFIQKSDITLDGAGYTIQGSGSGYGIYQNGITNILLKNLMVKEFSFGINLQYSDSNTITSSSISDDRWWGIYLLQSNDNIISYSNVSNNQGGIAISISNNNDISYNTIISNTRYFGLALSNSMNNTILHNNILSNKGFGIRFSASSNNSIMNNNVLNNGKGIAVYVGSNNALMRNNISSNDWEGIYFMQANTNTANLNNVTENEYGTYIDTSSNNIITENIFSSNTYGIYSSSGNNNVITDNSILNNDIGIKFQILVTDNVLYHNNIINNTQQVIEESNGMNKWDNGTDEGNYWSDYTGVDDGSNGRIPGDGVGDTLVPHPYTDQGNGYYQLDNYPLMRPRGLNEPPEIIHITNPDPVLVHTELSIFGIFIDPDEGDTHTAEWDWGDTSVSPGMVDDDADTVTGTHTYTSTGLYTVTLTVWDAAKDSDTEMHQYIVVYDPNGGFVTGGGWIYSPRGSYTPYPELHGKAKFAFTIKYKKGATAPMGNTQFKFRAAELSFYSITYHWLVITGSRVQFEGTGMINDEGEYGFMLTAIDGDRKGGDGLDRFRIKIWDMDKNDLIIYDNEIGLDDEADPTTVLSGGEIVIHRT